MNDVQQQALEFAVRRIVADVCGRSIGGTKLSMGVRELELRGKDEDEIGWRISRELRVEVPRVEWSSFRTIADLVLYVQMMKHHVETF